MESGNDELPLTDTGDIDSAETCDLKCCDVKDSCCFMLMSEQMERFIKNENNLPILDLKCKDCSKKICSSCLMENSQLTLIQKKLFLRTWQSIKVVKLNGELRVQADVSYKSDPLDTFSAVNSNFTQALSNLKQVVQSLKKKGPDALQSLKEEVEKKIALGTLVEVTKEEWELIKVHPHHYSLLTMVYSATSMSTEKRLINHSKTKVPNRATGMSLEQLNLENTLNNMGHILSGFQLYEHPLVCDISKAYLRVLVPYSTSKMRLFRP